MEWLSDCPRSASDPGAPNLAASGFFSGIVREPLNGLEAVVPVSADVRHWHASPRAAVEFLLHAATIDGSALGARRCLTMPGVSVTVGEQIEALAAVAGNDVARLVRYEPNVGVERTIADWPRTFDASGAEASASGRSRPLRRSSGSISTTSSAVGSPPSRNEPGRPRDRRRQRHRPRLDHRARARRIHCVCSGRGVETLEETASLAGNGAIAIGCDVRDPTSVEALFSAIHQRLGRLDVLSTTRGQARPPSHSMSFR